MDIEKLKREVHDFYVTAQADALDEAAFEDRLTDLLIEHRLKAVEEYQFPEERKPGFGSVPAKGWEDAKCAVALEPGKLRVPTTAGGFKETGCWYFHWEGLRLCVSLGIDPTRKEHWRITEPLTGMSIPEVDGETPVNCYANFMEALPHINAQIAKGKRYPGLVELLKNVVSLPASARINQDKRS